MTGHDDMNPFDTVARGNPLSQDQLPEPHSESAGRVLALVAARTEQAQRRRRRIRVVAIAAAALLVVAAAAYLSRAVTQANGVSCYTAPHLEADFAVAVPDEGLGNTETCVPLWLDGSMANAEVDARLGAPALVGCVAKDGRLLVFPSDDRALCDRLDLARLADSDVDRTDRAEVARLLEEFFAAGGCIDLKAAASAVEEALEIVEGGDVWHVDVGLSSEARPCASYSLDANLRTITLIPIPQPSDEG